MSNAAETEYLSDIFAERVFYFTQGWGELGMDTCAHAPNRTPLLLRIKNKRYEKKNSMGIKNKISILFYYLFFFLFLHVEAGYAVVFTVKDSQT